MAVRGDQLLTLPAHPLNSARTRPWSLYFHLPPFPGSDLARLALSLLTSLSSTRPVDWLRDFPRTGSCCCHLPDIASISFAERRGFYSQALRFLVAVSCGDWVGIFLWVAEFATGWRSQNPVVPNMINKACLRVRWKGLGEVLLLQLSFCSGKAEPSCFILPRPQGLGNHYGGAQSFSSCDACSASSRSEIMGAVYCPQLLFAKFGFRSLLCWFPTKSFR